MYDTKAKDWLRCLLAFVLALGLGFLSLVYRSQGNIVMFVVTLAMTVLAAVFVVTHVIMTMTERTAPVGVRYPWVWNRGLMRLLDEHTEVLFDGEQMRAIDMEVFLDSLNMRDCEDFSPEGRALYSFREIRKQGGIPGLKRYSFAESENEDVLGCRPVRERQIVMKNDEAGALRILGVADFRSKSCFIVKPSKREGECFALRFDGEVITKVTLADLEALWLATNVMEPGKFKACFSVHGLKEKEGDFEVVS